MNRKKSAVYKTLLSFALLAVLPVFVCAKTLSDLREIKGIVMDENNTPLPGVTIHETGTPQPRRPGPTIRTKQRCFPYRSMERKVLGTMCRRKNMV
nr:hypothetical protein [Chitinophaga sp.]